jgi:MerR family transcriptional regulator/heat shock protein HspR
MTEERDKVGPPASDRGVYGISVAAELSGISQQSLRLYERYGLVTPVRSTGGTRRYSADDLYRLQRISELIADGVNLAGIARILSLEDRNAALDDRNVALEGDNAVLEGDNTALRAHISQKKSPTQSSASVTTDNARGQTKRSPRRRKS